MYMCVCVSRPSLDRNMYRYAYICLYTHKHILYYDGDPELLKTKQSEYESLLLSEELEWPRRCVSLQWASYGMVGMFPVFFFFFKSGSLLVHSDLELTKQLRALNSWSSCLCVQVLGFQNELSLDVGRLDIMEFVEIHSEQARFSFTLFTFPTKSIVLVFHQYLMLLH